jgi:hypothetical protein
MAGIASENYVPKVLKFELILLKFELLEFEANTT